MKNNNRFHVKNKQSIKAIESTDERITGRAGLALFSRYLRSNQLMTIVELKFGSMRKNKKGIPVTDLFIQLLCFFMDGTSRHISWFDHLKRSGCTKPKYPCPVTPPVRGCGNSDNLPVQPAAHRRAEHRR